MKTLQSWNNSLHKYETITVPESWNITTFEVDMEADCDCASCGKSIKFGDGYCSLFLHDEQGFGYIVCSVCHYAIEMPKYCNKLDWNGR